MYSSPSTASEKCMFHIVYWVTTIYTFWALNPRRSRQKITLETSMPRQELCYVVVVTCVRIAQERTSGISHLVHWPVLVSLSHSCCHHTKTRLSTACLAFIHSSPLESPQFAPTVCHEVDWYCASYYQDRRRRDCSVSTISQP